MARTSRGQAKTRKILTRRQFLTTAGAGVAGAAILPLAPWESGVAPAQIRGTTLRILAWSHFVPQFDAFYDKFAADWGKENGVDVRVDHVNIYDVPARVAAERAAGAGHDVAEMTSIVLTTLYYKYWVDISDIVGGLGNKYGGWLPMAEQLGKVGGTWYAMPDYYIAQPLLHRTDLFNEYGITKFGTWDDLLNAARIGKSKGHPAGMAISHCNDANHNARAVFYAFGVEETDPSGKEIRWDSKELREAMKFYRTLWAEGMTSEVFSWDDASDNRYLGSGVAIWIHDAISALRSLREPNPDLYAKIDVGVSDTLEPAGPSGRGYNVVDPLVKFIWKFSRNISAAREFLEFWGNHVQDSMIQSTGYNMPMLKGFYKKPMHPLAEDAKVGIMQDWLKVTAIFGYPGPATAPAAEVLATFVVPDMIARYAQSNDLEGSVKWGMEQIKRTYAKYA